MAFFFFFFFFLRPKFVTSVAAIMETWWKANQWKVREFFHSLLLLTTFSVKAITLNEGVIFMIYAVSIVNRNIKEELGSIKQQNSIPQ